MLKFWERPESPTTATKDRFDAVYGLSGVTDAATVQGYALQAVPNTRIGPFGVLYRQDVIVKSEGWQMWRVDVPYAPRQSTSSGIASVVNWSFDTTGATVKQRTSYSTTKYPSGATPDFKGAIDVDGTTVRGVDVIIPALKIDVEVEHPTGVLTLPFMKTVAAMTGKTNSVPFLSFAIGEVLFAGGTGSDGTNSPAKAKYQFLVQANKSNFSVGDVTGIDKPGWDYAWVKFKTVKSGDFNARQPEYVFIERVYENTNFQAVLGFG